MTTKRIVSLLVFVLLAVPAVSRPVHAASNAERAAVKRAELAAKVKENVAHLGTGPDARIELRRGDGSRLVGFVTEAQASSFSVRDASGAVTQVPYDDVSKVKGHNLATGWKIAIGAGALLALLFVLVWAGAIGDAER